MLLRLSADHVSHLENVSEDEINRLLGMVVDVENLFMSVHKEENTDTKQVYFYLFKVSTHVKSVTSGKKSRLVLCVITSFFFFFPVAAEEMHPADEPAGGGRITGQSAF